MISTSDSQKLKYMRPLLPESVKGFITGIQIADFIQLLHTGRENSILQVYSGDRIGRLFFWDGELVKAEFPGCDTDREAALEILSWDDTSIELIDNPRFDENRINESLSALLMQAMCLKDERQGGGPSADPDEPTEAAGKVEPIARVADTGDDPDEETGAAVRDTGAHDQQQTSTKEEALMATQQQIDAILEKLTQIDGSYGGTLVSRDGMVVATRLDKRYAGDKIAALASDAVRVCNKVIVEAQFGKTDSMIIEGTDGKMCLINAPKGGMFIILIGNKDLNIGMARITLQEAIDALEAIS